jgi:ferredoxin-type protein NapF
MSGGLSRRAFLNVGGVSGNTAIRPPWSVAEDAFTAACDQCGACLWSCPEGILLRGPDGFPVVDFSKNACTFCDRCAAACDRGAFLAERDGAPWSVSIAITAGCISGQGVACRVCGDFCDTRAIKFFPTLGGSARPQVDDAVCTGCGACIAPCPVGAIEARG